MTHFEHLRVVRFPLMIALLLPLSCSRAPDRPKPEVLVPLRGRVTDGGIPVANMIVDFHPLAEDGTRARGMTNKDGRYQLIHESDQPGIEAGMYQISFWRFDRSLARTGKDRIAPRERIEVEQSTVTVPEQGGTLDLELREQDTSNRGAFSNRIAMAGGATHEN